jgi:hypothetical protein
MVNVLSDAKKQQVVGLGRLDWSLRRIEQATGVRRETASAYLKAAGLVVRGRGRWPEVRSPDRAAAAVPAEAEASKPAISAEGVSTDSGTLSPVARLTHLR